MRGCMSTSVDHWIPPARQGGVFNTRSAGMFSYNQRVASLSSGLAWLLCSTKSHNLSFRIASRQRASSAAVTCKL